LPIFIADAHEAHRNLGGGPRGAQRVRPTARHGILGGCPDNDRFGANCSKAIDVRTQVQLYDVTLGEILCRERVRAVWWGVSF
jgi:hypothetical protein